MMTRRNLFAAILGVGAAALAPTRRPFGSGGAPLPLIEADEHPLAMFVTVYRDGVVSSESWAWIDEASQVGARWETLKGRAWRCKVVERGSYRLALVADAPDWARAMYAKLRRGELA